MRVYDNDTPGGRPVVVDRPESHGQASAAPVHRCGRRMSLRPSLHETDWRRMNPNSPTWEEETELRLTQLRREVERLAKRGASKYICTRCEREKHIALG